MTRAVAASSDAPTFQVGEGGPQPTPPLQLTAECGIIRESQMGMFGAALPIGAFKGSLAVRVISRGHANALMRANHYSHSVSKSSTIHLGVYWQSRLVGALQYGFAMNAASQASVVEGTRIDEYLELNRMWISDEMPRNTESAAIAQSIHYIKAVRPRVAWIQSFADERCSRLGVVYQAANFLYCGFHVSTFYELDGRFFHNSLATRQRIDNRASARTIQGGLDRATRYDFRQFRYVKFLKRGWQHRLRYPVLPYPKLETAA